MAGESLRGCVVYMIGKGVKITLTKGLTAMSNRFILPAIKIRKIYRILFTGLKYSIYDGRPSEMTG